MNGELVIYRLRSGKEKEFLHLHSQIVAEYKENFPGFVSARTLRCVADKQTLIDLWTWQSPEAALEARRCFKSLPSAKSFMDTIDRVEWSGLVEAWLEVDN